MNNQPRIGTGPMAAALLVASPMAAALLVTNVD
jgi:hypothetical protein